ncbi:TIGR03749 family integrating conjugative element protein [Porticoccus sp. GXU_MW_L64]
MTLNIFSHTTYWVLAVALIFAPQLPAQAQSLAPERVVWEKRPIPVHIEQGQERIVHFPSDVRYWLPDRLQRKVSVVAANGVLYIRANEAFPKTRIRVQSLTDQRIFLLDVSSDLQKDATNELVVMLPGSSQNRAKQQATKIPAEDWRIRLTRFAAQQLYAPERLLDGDPAIRRIPINENKPLALFRGGQLEVTPIAAWRGGGFTVTAIKLINLTDNAVALNFQAQGTADVFPIDRQIRGNWLTATFQHQYLGPLGQPDDTTTLYLISKRAFSESLGLWHVDDQTEGAGNDG